MAMKRVDMGLIMALVTMLWAAAEAQSDCRTALISLSPCLNYVQGNSSTPSSSCCSQLTNVVRSSPQCLCTVLNDGGSSLGISINATLALTLPGACNVQTPPVSRCNANGDSTSPADFPSGTPAGTSTGGDSSNESRVAFPVSLLFTLFFISSYASTLTTF